MKSLIFLIGFIPFLSFSQSDKIFEKVDEMPKYAGCEDAVFPKCTLEQVREFILTELSYPESARKNNVEGTALVTFVIRKNGDITDLNVVQDPGDGCGEEALRVMQKMANTVQWIPGKEGGEVVNVSFNLPIQFRL